MTDSYRDTKRMLAMRDRMLRDAYHGRNGLSMSEEERAEYRAQQRSAREARKIMRRQLEAQCAIARAQAQERNTR